MGFFSKGPSIGGIPKKRLSLEEGILVAGLLFFCMYAFTAIFGKMIGLEFALGPIAIVFLVVISAFASLAITMKMMRGRTIDAKDMTSWFMIVGFALVVIIYLPDLAPDLFEQSALSLKSSLPLP